MTVGTASRVRWNSLFSLLSQFIRLGTNMIMFMGIARFYGVEEFGQFTTAHTYTSLFFIFADFGFDLMLTTEIARNRENASVILQQYLPFKLLFSLSALILLISLAFFSNHSTETKVLIYIFSLGIVGNAFSNYFFSFMRGLEELQHEAKISFFQNSVLLMLLFILGVFNVKVVYFAFAFVLSRFLGFGMMLRIIKKILNNFSLKFTFFGWRRILKCSLPYGIHLIFGVLFFQIDTILLSWWSGDRAVGIYQSVFKLIALTLIIPDVLISALLPTLTRYFSEESEKWKVYGKFLIKILIYISLPISLLFFTYPEQIIQLLYGENNYNEAIILLKIFSFVVFIRFFVETYALILTTTQQQFKRMKIVVFATIINILMNIYTIPKFGVQGAAIASLITNMVTGVLYIWTVNSSTLKFYHSLDYRMISSIFITGIFALLLTQLFPQSVLYGGLFILLFYTIYYYFIGLTLNERSLVFKITESKKIELIK
jgi:O-antigen/teichoic acid export membrane protein